MSDVLTNDNNKNTPEYIRLVTEQETAHRKIKVLGVRLNLAQAFHSMWIKAYDALLHHSVNVRSLPEYNDHAALDRALEVGVADPEGASRVMDYIKRVESGIRAAVARKGFKKV